MDDVSREGLSLDTGGVREHPPSHSGSAAGSFDGSESLLAPRFDGADLSQDGMRATLLRETARWRRRAHTTYLRRTDGADASPLAREGAGLSQDGTWALVVRWSPEAHLRFCRRESESRETSGRRHRSRITSLRSSVRTPNRVAAEEKGKPPRSTSSTWTGSTSSSLKGDVGDARVAGRPAARRSTMRPAPDRSGRRRRAAAVDRGCPSEDFLVQWSADGKTLYVRGEEGPLTLYRLDLATGRRELWKQPAPPDRGGLPRVWIRVPGAATTPDGRFDAYSSFSDLQTLTLTDFGLDWWR